MQRKYKIAALVCALCVTVDQVVKTVVKAALAPEHLGFAGRAYDIIPGVLELRYAQNTGMAFGIDVVARFGLSDAWRTPIFLSITLVAVLIILHLLSQAPARAIRLPAGLGFILSGAFGNLIDRFRWGFVVDFIRFKAWPPSGYYWPTFNLADSFITIGITILVIDALFSREPAPEAIEEPSDQDGQCFEAADQAATGEEGPTAGS